jgi:toxin ParE1/3/4
VNRVSFHRLAERELSDAALYYEGESPGLGIKFLDEIEQYIGAIVTNPKAGRKIRGEVRRHILRKFPHGILYSVKDDGIRILAIRSLKRKPNYWVGRFLNSCPTAMEPTRGAPWFRPYELTARAA